MANEDTMSQGTDLTIDRAQHSFKVFRATSEVSDRGRRSVRSNRAYSVAQEPRLTQVTRTGELREVTGNDATITRLFMSGHAAMVIPAGKTMEEAQDGITKSRSRPSGVSVNAQGDEDYPEVAFFPDPPCVLPFEDSEGEDQETIVLDKAHGPQAYWKEHARVLESCKPELEQQREINRKFSAELHEQNETNFGKVLAFVSIALKPIGVRSRGSLAEKYKTGRVVQPGETVLVSKVYEKDHIRFLKLHDDGGWLFENTDPVTFVMAEMKYIELGQRWHRVTCPEYLYVRKAPVYDSAARTSYAMAPGELTVVDLRCTVRGWKFLRLGDGRGWVFVMRPGVRKDNTELHNMCIMDVDSEVVNGAKKVDYRSLLPSTDKAVEVGSWTYVVMKLPVLAIGARIFGTYLNPGDVVKVDKRAYDNGNPPTEHVPQTLWLRLKDMRGWVPQSEDGHELLALRHSDLPIPNWLHLGRSLDDGPEELVGLA